MTRDANSIDDDAFQPTADWNPDMIPSTERRLPTNAETVRYGDEDTEIEEDEHSTDVYDLDDKPTAKKPGSDQPANKTVDLYQKEKKAESGDGLGIFETLRKITRDLNEVEEDAPAESGARATIDLFSATQSREEHATSNYAAPKKEKPAPAKIDLTSLVKQEEQSAETPDVEELAEECERSERRQQEIQTLEALRGLADENSRDCLQSYIRRRLRPRARRRLIATVACGALAAVVYAVAADQYWAISVLAALAAGAVISAWQQTRQALLILRIAREGLHDGQIETVHG